MKRRKIVLQELNIPCLMAGRVKIFNSHRLKRSDNVLYLTLFLFIMIFSISIVPRGNQS